MKTLLVWISIGSLMTVYGCSNVKFVKSREDCGRNIIMFIPWDNCGESSRSTVVRSRDIRGEKGPKKTDRTEVFEEYEEFIDVE